MKFALTSDTRGPTINPPRTAYAALGMVAPAPAVAFNKPPDCILVTVAPEKFAPEISHPPIFRFVRSVFDKFALTRRTFGPTIFVPLTTYAADGSVAVASPVIPPVRIPVIFAPERFAVVSVALRRDVFVMFAFWKSVLVRTTPLISIPERSVPARLTPAPIMNPVPLAPPVFRTIYPVFRVAVVPPMRPPLRRPVSVVDVKIAPEISAFARFAFVKLLLVKLALVSVTPDKSTPVRVAL